VEDGDGGPALVGVGDGGPELGGEGVDGLELGLEDAEVEGVERGGHDGANIVRPGWCARGSSANRGA